ncbi:extracellular solute-binding protein [Clostridium sediminicola]|uniref:extracellular solute-binding protein n=1 Tax=Clostridium sediminicola TaxID=3114879 RepID=UPI0031F2346A
MKVLCKKNFKFIISILLISVLAFTGCMTSSNNKNNSTNKEKSKELTIYSGRREKFTLPLVEKFQAETGIKVNLITGKATEYAHRIVEEDKNTKADVFLANDAGVLEYLRLQDMLALIDSEEIEKVPMNYRGKGNTWTGITVRSRIFMYNKDLITQEEMAKSMYDLTDSKYKGQFAINRAGNESMVTYFTSIKTIIGEEKTLQLMKDIMANDPLILKSHTEVRRAVGSGEVKFGLVNNYHLKVQLTEDGMNNVAAIYPDQDENGMGTFVNVSGAAITKYANNPVNALSFIEFLLQEEQQKMNAETPIIPNIEGIKYEEFKASKASLGEVGPEWESTTELMREAGYSD